MLIVHKIASWYLSKRLQRIEGYIREPIATQVRIWKDLLNRAQHTAWGQRYGYGKITSYNEFRERVPISTYEQFFPYIQRIIKGESDVLWPGRIDWFAKSSGTTNDKSKFIPISKDSFDELHFKAGRDMLTLYLEQRPDSRLFSGKSLSITGSHEFHSGGIARSGDLSAVLVENLPIFYELVRTPSKRITLMSEWESKIDVMADEIIHEDITGFAGVPTWALVLINKVFEKLEMTDRNVLDVWPNLEVFMHGGVNFEPYRSQFEALIPSRQMNYMNIYNASEGFFGVQDDFERDDMLLFLDYGIFYEFLPLEELDKEKPQAIALEEVEIGKTYALVISTNGGLWRYLIGDTVTFTSTAPFRIRIAGRTKHFINAFGEELMVGNAEKALVQACRETGAAISNYTAAPIYFTGAEQGGHEWLIEFKQAPDNLARFSTCLDNTLKQLNSDYEAKRYHDMALRFPTVRHIASGTFYDWMKKRGKLGGQNKVPRLSNDRRYVDDILEMLEQLPDKKDS